MQLSNSRDGQGLSAIRKLPTRVGFQGDGSAVDVDQIIASWRLGLGVFRRASPLHF
jgi:hypothetical protein